MTGLRAIDTSVPAVDFREALVRSKNGRILCLLDFEITYNSIDNTAWIWTHIWTRPCVRILGPDDADVLLRRVEQMSPADLADALGCREVLADILARQFEPRSVPQDDAKEALADWLVKEHEDAVLDALYEGPYSSVEEPPDSNGPRPGSNPGRGTTTVRRLDNGRTWVFMGENGEFIREVPKDGQEKADGLPAGEAEAGAGRETRRLWGLWPG